MTDNKLPNEDDFGTIEKIALGFFILAIIGTIATPFLL